VHERRYLLSNSAMEIFFKNQTTVFFNFPNETKSESNLVTFNYNLKKKKKKKKKEEEEESHKQGNNVFANKINNNLTLVFSHRMEQTTEER